jgi:coproporphyrinogen III oxidase-like Fe-S oxidoreductase
MTTSWPASRSAAASEGRRSAHNLNYWRFGDYLGLGAGAHGKITLPEEGAIERRVKTRNPRTFGEQAGSAAAVSRERIDAPRQAALEFLLNALRLVDGVDGQLFTARAGQPLEAIAAARSAAVARGWLAPDADALRATPLGIERLNRLLELFA